MTEESRPCRALWAAVVLKAYRDVGILEEFDAMPELDLHQRKRVRLITSSGDPTEFLASDYCHEILSMIGINR